MDKQHSNLEVAHKFIQLMEYKSLEESKLFIEHYEQRIKYKSKLLAILEDEEPPKLFKKAHQKWEDEKNQLENELEDAYQKLYEEHTFAGELMISLAKEKSPAV